eukprot:2254415-Pyramimonas_sp.AAC.1
MGKYGKRGGDKHPDLRHRNGYLLTGALQFCQKLPRSGLFLAMQRCPHREGLGSLGHWAKYPLVESPLKGR